MCLFITRTENNQTLFIILLSAIDTFYESNLNNIANKLASIIKAIDEMLKSIKN